MLAQFITGNDAARARWRLCFASGNSTRSSWLRAGFADEYPSEPATLRRAWSLSILFRDPRKSTHTHTYTRDCTELKLSCTKNMQWLIDTYKLMMLLRQMQWKRSTNCRHLSWIPSVSFIIKLINIESWMLVTLASELRRYVLCVCFGA